MKQIVECVPNFSEGRDKETIEAIARAKGAENLLEAIDALRAKLTPEQLEKVAGIEARIRARHGRHGRCSRRGFNAPPPDHSAAPDADAPEESGAPPAASEE